MPIPKITNKLVKSAEPVQLGWNLLVLSEVPRAQASSSGNSVNYFYDFTIEAGPGNSTENAEKSITYMVNGAALEAGITEVCGPYLQLMGALTGLTAEELVDKEINENQLVGRKVWADIGERIVEGKSYKDFKCFTPATQIPF